MMESSTTGGFGDESSSISEAPSANTDHHSADDAGDNDGGNEKAEEEESSWTTYIVDFLINEQEETTPSFPLPQETTGPKRRKSKGSSVDRVDEALEDTASSPIHTPKVEETRLQPELTEDMGTGRGEREVVGSGRGGGGGRGGDSRLLKERGLCLVPLSMAVNFLG